MSSHICEPLVLLVCARFDHDPLIKAEDIRMSFLCSPSLGVAYKPHICFVFDGRQSRSHVGNMVSREYPQC
jgi:hypothetical protein